MMMRPLFFLVIFMVLTFSGWSQPVYAAYPCPAGPGPNEILVGHKGGSGPDAGLPMCTGRGGTAPASAPPTYYYTYGSIAWHPNVDDVWMVGNYNVPNAAAREALAACNKAMGGGCSSIGEWHNSSMSIVRDRNGILWNAWNGQGGAARKKLLAECAAKQPLPCEVIGSFGSGKRSYSPNLATALKKYSVAAWVNGGDGFDNRLYIAGGFNDVSSAEKVAIEACANATRRRCGAVAFAGNGVIQTYETVGVGYSVTQETSAKRAQQAVKILCKQQKKSCKLQMAYDSRTPGLRIHDFAVGASR